MKKMKLNTLTDTSAIVYVYAAFLMALFAFSFCTLPNFILLDDYYKFDTPSLSSLIKFNLPRAQITLDDDIMIAMRAGYMIHETGAPQYNLSDLAQPSTSYLSPYVFYLLDMILPRSQSPFFYGLLYLFAALTSLLLIYKSARIKSNAILLIILFLLTSTL